MSELEALRAEVAALRKEVADLRADRVVHHYHHQAAPTRFVHPVSPTTFPSYPLPVSTCSVTAETKATGLSAYNGGLQ